MWYTFQSGSYLIALKIPLKRISLGVVSSACCFLRSSYQAGLQGAWKGSGSSFSPERDLKRWLGECRRFVIAVVSPNPLCFKNHGQNFKGACWALAQMSAVEVQRLRGVPLEGNAEGNDVGWAPHCSSGRLGLNFLWAQGELPGAQGNCVLISPNSPHVQ